MTLTQKSCNGPCQPNISHIQVTQLVCFIPCKCSVPCRRPYGLSHEILNYFNIVPWSLRSVWTVTLNLARVFQHELSFVQLGLMLPRATRDYAYLLHVFVSRFGFNHLGPLGITLTTNRALFPTHSSWIAFPWLYAHVSHRAIRVLSQGKSRNTGLGRELSIYLPMQMLRSVFLYVAMVPRDPSLN